LKLEEKRFLLLAFPPPPSLPPIAVLCILRILGPLNFVFLGALVILGILGALNNLLNLTEEPRKKYVAIMSQKKALDMMQVV
jgi:hypothetical protein